MAESDEPKCKNCKHWFVWTEVRPFGHCHKGAPNEGGFVHAKDLPVVPDLSLCSAWEASSLCIYKSSRN